jgi:hypothetical protein
MLKPFWMAKPMRGWEGAVLRIETLEVSVAEARTVAAQWGRERVLVRGWRDGRRLARGLI